MPPYWPVFVAIFILILGGFLAFKVDWAAIVYRIYRDKPWCGHMEVWNGKGWDIVDGWRVAADLYGSIFNYEYNKKVYEVRVGRNYPVQYVERGRLIRCSPHSLVALPLGGPEQNPLEPQFTEEQIGLQTYGWALVQANKSIRGKAVGSWFMFLIIGLVVIAIVVGVIIYLRSQNSSTETPGATPTPTQTPGQVKPLPSASAFDELVEVRYG